MKMTGLTELPDLQRWCARAYAVIAAPVMLLLVLVAHPFGVPDEDAHFKRALALSHGGLLPRVLAHDPDFDERPTAGGLIDRGANELLAQVHALGNAPVHRWTQADIRQNLTYHAGDTVYARHSNTAIYPPFLYVAAAVASAIGRLLGLPVLVWLYLARVANLLVAGWLIWRTIRRAGDLAPFLLVTATLPIVLTQVASASADSLLFALVIAFAGMLGRLSAGERIGTGDTVLLSVGAAMMAMAKVAYLPLALLGPLSAYLADRNGRVWRPVAAATMLGIATWLVWNWWIRDSVFSIRPADVVIDPAAQLEYILADPLRVARLFARTMLHDAWWILRGLVGTHLGWLAILMPGWFTAATLALWLTLAAVSTSSVIRSPVPLFAALVAAAGCYMAIYLLLYLQYNGVGANEIVGIQARYFLPLAIVVLCLTPRLRLSAASAGPAVLGAAVGWSALSGVVTLVTIFNATWR